VRGRAAGWTFGIGGLQQVPAVVDAVKVCRPPLSKVLVARIEIEDEDGNSVCVATGSGTTASGAIENARARLKTRANEVVL
jgi:hypothetical protein